MEYVRIFGARALCSRYKRVNIPSCIAADKLPLYAKCQSTMVSADTVRIIVLTLRFDNLRVGASAAPGAAHGVLVCC